MNLALRTLEYTDIEWLRDLRNASREHFFDHREITPEAQEAWWRSAAWGDERWVIWRDDQVRLKMREPYRVGYFSIVTPKPDLPIFPTDGRPVRYFSTMIVAAEHRGQGAILAANYAFDTASTVYVGYVGEGNATSLRACEKLGFTDRGKYRHPVYGPIHIVWRNK